jgi:hypothetical protein
VAPCRVHIVATCRAVPTTGALRALRRKTDSVALFPDTARCLASAKPLSLPFLQVSISRLRRAEQPLRLLLVPTSADQPARSHTLKHARWRSRLFMLVAPPSGARTRDGDSPQLRVRRVAGDRTERDQLGSQATAVRCASTERRAAARHARTHTCIRTRTHTRTCTRTHARTRVAADYRAGGEALQADAAVSVAKGRRALGAVYAAPELCLGLFAYVGPAHCVWPPIAGVPFCACSTVARVSRVVFVLSRLCRGHCEAWHWPLRGMALGRHAAPCASSVAPSWRMARGMVCASVCQLQTMPLAGSLAVATQNAQP